MNLRHIRPRSIEWYDALLEQEDRGYDRLSPEELVRLRTLLAAEQAQPTTFMQRALQLVSQAHAHAR